MDDNYLMRKEGLTMTNEDSVKHKSVAWAQSCVRATQSHPPAPATRPLPWPQLSSLAEAKCAQKSLWHLWLVVLGVPSQVWTPRWWAGCEHSGNRVKKQDERVVRKKEQGERERIWWNEKRKKTLGKINVLEASKKWSKCQQWRWRTRSKKTWKPRAEKKEGRKINQGQ